MAQPYRPFNDPEVQDQLNNLPVVPEAPPVDIARAQTLARSGKNPDAQREGQAMFEEQRRQQEAAQRQAEAAQRDQAAAQRQADAEARRIRNEQEAARARDVRAAAAQGIKTKTDVETGKKTIATHPDGAPVWKAGPQGGPQFLGNQTAAVRDPSGQVQAAPASNPLIPDDGALGATGGMSKAVFGQQVRDDRGNVSTVEPDTTTDPKTGRKVFSSTDPTTGQTVKQAVGIDEAAQAKIRKDAELEQRRQELLLRKNAVDQERLRFQPKWEPAKAEFDDASKNLAAINAKPFRRNAAGAWEKFDPATNRTLPTDRDEVAVWQQSQKQAQARLDAAKAKHDQLFPIAENLNRNETAIKDERLRLAEEKIRTDAGLPDNDGGVSRILAKDVGEIDLTPEDEAADEVEQAATRQAAPGELEQSGPPSPLLSDNTKTAFSALSGLEGASIEQRESFSAINRNGQWIASMERNGGHPIITLRDEARAQEDVQAIVSKVGKGGVPIYLRDNPARPKITDEAREVATIFATIKDPAFSQEAGAPPRALTNRLIELGADPVTIQKRIDAGTLSVQAGQTLLESLYGQSVASSSNPADPADFQRWLEESTAKADKALQDRYGNPALRAQDAPGRRFAKAKGGVFTSADDQENIRKDYIRDRYLENRGKPGWDRKKLRELYASDISGTMGLGAKAQSAATSVGSAVVNDVVGSMLGLLGGQLVSLGAGEAALFGNEEAKKMLSEDTKLRNRDFANWANGVKRNAKAWGTAEGRARGQELESALTVLQNAIDEEEDAIEPNSARIAAAEMAVRNAALGMHALAPDESWPITADSLDPNKDQALGTALANYKATGDPRDFQLYKERLLMSNGRRQYSAELQAKTGNTKGKFFQAVNGAMYAGWQELGTELVADAAMIFTAGASKTIQGGLKAVGAVGKANRVARLGNSMARSIEAIEKFGIKAATLQKPLTGAQKVMNAGVRTVQGAIGEGFEEVIAELGADSPDLAGAFLSGTIGVIGLAPAYAVAAGVRSAVDGVAPDTKMAARNEKWANRYNAMMADTPGFEPITGEQAGIARNFIDPKAYESTRQKLTALEQQFADVAGDSPEAAAEKSQLRAMIGEELQKAALQAEQGIAAVSAIRDVQDPAKRTFYTALAKVAAGNVASLTQNERKAVAGARTREGAEFFAQVPQADGRVIEVLTDEARAEIMTDLPEVGALIQTTESQALFDAQIAAQPLPPIEPATTPPNEPYQQGTSGPQGAAQNPQSPPANAPTPGGALPGGLGQQPAPTPANGAGNAPATPQAPVVPPLSIEGLQARPTADLQAEELRMKDILRQNVTDPEGQQNAALAQEGLGRVRAELQRRAQDPNFIEPAPAAAPAAPQDVDATPSAPAPPSAPTSPAETIAREVRDKVVAKMPQLSSRLQIVPESLASGGADLVIETGVIRLSVADIKRAIDRANGDVAKAAASIENIVTRHEVVHVVQVEALRPLWEAAGSPGTFEAFFLDYYEKLAPQLLTPAAEKAARKIYGDAAWDRIPTEGQAAAEFVRMLVEAKLSGKTDQFSELFRAINNRGAKSALVKLIRAAIGVLQKMNLKGEAAKHVAAIEELYKQLTTAESTAKEPATPPAAPAPSNQGVVPPPPAAPDVNEANPNRLILLKKDAGQSEIRYNGEVLWRGPDDQAQGQMESFQAAQESPMFITGGAINAALERFPRLGGKFRAELEAASEEIEAELDALPAGERAAAAERAISDRIDRIADKEAERTGKNRMEIIEGFRAVAGKRAGQQAASIEQAVIGTQAPVIPAGRSESRPTPNGEMTVDVVSTFVDLDQLIGSSDPLFPGGALQPRNRATQASQNQREEMVKNLRDKPDQHRRYLEGVTTDSGRPVIAPLFAADGSQMTNEAGKPLFYVISGNGRRNALAEAAARKVAGPVTAGFREAATAEGIDVQGMSMPVPVSVFVPTSAKEAIDLAEYSNRDAQLSVTNTEQAKRDAASIEQGNILKLWEPDASGDPAAASNRRFVQSFARAVGDEGILDQSGALTDEGAKRIERAMVATLLGPDKAPMMEILFNRTGPLGLRAILGGIASETGNLLKLAASKPDFDLSPVLADALTTAVQAKAALAAGEIRDVGEFFDQGNLFDSTDNTTPERQLARALVESRSRKAVREILGAYLRGAEAVDTSTMSMFAEAETTREDLISAALDARPIDQVLAEVATEFGQNADLPAKLRVAAAGIKKLPLEQRKAMNGAIGAEVERLRDGVISAQEWQRLNPDALTPMEALFQRFLDSNSPDSIQANMGKLLASKAQAVLASSVAPALPENVEFVRFPESSGTLGIPRRRMPQVKGSDRPEFMEFLRDRGVTFTNEDMSPADIIPVQAEYAPAKVERAKGIPFERRIFVSADNYLLDGHHQWLAQMERPTVKVTRLSLDALPALDAIFSFPKTTTSDGLATLGSSPMVPEVDGVPDDVRDEIIRKVTNRINASEKYDAKFQAIIDEIAADNDRWTPLHGPVKKIGRSAQKAMEEWKQNADNGFDLSIADAVSSLKDLVRASIVVESAAEFDAAIQSIGKRFKIERVKNRWEKPLPSGYSDILINVATPTGWAEIQLHIPEMLIAKEGWQPWFPEGWKPVNPMPRTGHEYYEEQRMLVSSIPGWRERHAALDEIMIELYGSAHRAHFERTNSRPPVSFLNRFFTSSQSEGTSLKLMAFSSPSDPSALMTRTNDPTKTAGDSPSPRNAGSAPSGTLKETGEAVITSPYNQTPGAIQDISGSSLGSSPAPMLDLFGDIEEAITGPRAKMKRNALAEIRKAPDKAKTAIAKDIAKREGLADLDLFAAAAVKSLAKKPKRDNSAGNDSARGQLGFTFDSQLFGGQPTESADRPGGNGQTQGASGNPGGTGGRASGQTGGRTPSGISGAEAGLRGGGSDGAGTTPDIGGGGTGASGTAGGGQDSGQVSADAGKRKLIERQRPPLNSPERNFSIGKNTVLAEGGAVTRIRNNVAAIDLLRQLESENRNATVEEKAVLAKFVGWGGLPQVFDEEKMRKIESGEAATRRQTATTYERYGAQYAEMVKSYREQADALDKWDEKWGGYYRQIKALMTPDEWESARESTINAHFTSPLVIGGMWDAVKRLGFRGGNTLEPAGGIGHFYGMMPPSLVGRSRLFGIELDSISGRIFSKLYPEADIEVTGFQDTTLPDNSQDLVISNVPFANITISDEYLDAQEGAPAFNLHNYFFERALRMARPGGLIAFISTANTMDAQIAQRKWIAERSEFMGAIRLPNNAFKGNANTEVVTDIIFLRKPDGSPNPMAAERWVSTESVTLEGGGSIEINEYFARHPEMILGRLADDGSMYGGRKEMTVHPTGDLGEQLRAAIALLPENVVGEGQADEIERLSTENRTAKDGAFIEENGVLRIKGTATTIPAADAGRVRSFMKLRDALNSLYAMEADPQASDADIAAQRKALNQAYDGHKAVYQYLHDPKNKKLLEVDPDFFRALGLEVPAGPSLGRKQEFTKADVFSKRVLQPRVAPESAETIEDALLHSFRWKGRLDAGYVGKLLGISREEAETQLLATEFAFRNPATGKVEHSTNYLAGNVRKKLRDAEMAAKKEPAMLRNVDALRAALPADVPWSDINFKMGSAWIPAEMYERFMAEKIFNGRRGASIIYNKGVGDLIGDSFVVQSAVGGYPASVDVQWGTPRKTAAEIAEALLNQRDPRVTDRVESKTVFNPAETDKARQAAARMADTFQEWVSANPDVQESLHRIYNENFNSHVIPKYDGSFMQLPWVASDFDLYPDKKHVVWRALQEGSLLVAHGVGGGKTIIGTSIAMEARRLGIAKKPLIVVHNATLEQFAATIAKMAPTARVLVARKTDLEGPKRKEFMGRVRSGDWDAVVMAHSTFDLIPDDPEWERKQTADLIKELEDAIRESDENVDMDGDLKKIKDPSVKELVKMRRRLKERMSNLQARRTDDVLTFQELGIDAMIVDEVHRYKKQPFVTRQSNIAGIDTGFSKRGSAMQLRSKWVQAINQGRGVWTMTGTPVTNTLGESWNMVRLVRPDLLQEFGVRTFDRFVSVFGNIKQSGELRPNGQYKAVTRLSEFTNIPEWNRFWGLAADVKMGEDMEVKGRPRIKGGKPSLTAVERTSQVKNIIDEISRVIDRYDQMTGKEKHENQHIPLLTYNAARMAAIDVRLINPEAKDEPGSKVNTALRNVMRLYRDTTADKGTQVIFSDSYRPLRTTKLDLSAAEFEREVGDENATESDEETGFNLYHDIREKLVGMDVPRSEIAIISEAKNDKQREAIFAKVNTGEVRIILGSTETLGTGVNMQERMIAAHHLDVPWTPAGLEQRDGRVYRQGNIWAEKNVEIEIMRYGMKDTLDAALWQKLETKERMIKQAVSGKVNARSIEDDAGLLNYMEQKAALSGADGMLKFTLDENVRQLKNDWRAHRNRQFDLQRQTAYSQAEIRNADEALPTANRVAQAVAPLVGADPAEVEWTIQGGAPLKGEDARKALDVTFKERRKAAGAIMNPESAESIREPIRVTANGVPIMVKVMKIDEDLANAANPDLRWAITWLPTFEAFDSPAGWGSSSPHPGSVINQMPTLAQTLAVRPNQFERTKAQAEKDIALYADEMQKPFTGAADFRKALLDQAVLYRRMGISPPESSEVYAAGIGENWEAAIDEAVKASQASGRVQRGETPANYPGRGLAPEMATLGSSPAPESSAAVQTALEKMPAIYRKVFEAVNAGAGVSEVQSRFNISAKAVDNILNQVNARITAATRAASPTGLQPVMRDGLFDGGRPDLALSTNPTVAAIDQIRNDSDVPDVRSWNVVGAEVDAALAKDYQGEYARILSKARDLQPFTDTEVAIAKRIIANETLAGKIQTPEERTKLAMLIHGYRDIGTETARSLAIRRDPAMSPAERHAQYIAEALFTPDEGTRERLRKAPKASHEKILAGWMARVDSIKAELLAQGIDLDASLAEFNAAKQAREVAEQENPAAKQAFDETYRKLTAREKAVVNSVREGALLTAAAFRANVSVEDARAIYVRFMADIKASMTAAAKRYVTATLGSSPAMNAQDAILADLGLYDISLIDDTVKDFVDRRKEKPRAPRKPRTPKAPEEAAPAAPKVPGLTPEQQAALDEAFERFSTAPPSTWTAWWQETARKLTPMIGQTSFEQFRERVMQPWRDRWQTEMDAITNPAGRMTFEEWIAKPATAEKVKRERDMFAPPVSTTTGERSTNPVDQGRLLPTRPDLVSTTTGTFDIHDPIAVKRVMDAFAIARGGKMDAIMEFWRMSILTGPQTHVVNVGSNVLNAAYNLLPRRVVEAGVNSALSAVGLGSKEQATLSEFSAMSKNLRKAASLAGRNMLRSWAIENRVFEAYATAEAQQLDFSGVGTEYIPPALGGKFGKVMRSLSFRAMTAADEFIKSFYGQLEAAAQAHRIASVEEKLKGTAYERRITELMEPGSKAWVRALDESKRITFQQEMDSKDPRAIRRMDQLAQLAKNGRAMPWIGRPLTFFLPFIDTPTNIFKQAVEMSPIGGFLAVVDGTRALRRRIFRGELSKEEATREASLLYDRARLVQDLTNQTLAWATYFALQGLVEPPDDDEEGLPVITGTVPYKTTRRGERDNAYAVMPPMTIRIGNTQFSYSRVEPFATVGATMVDLLVTMNRHGGMKPEVASEWLSRFKDQVKDKTFLQGVSNLLNAVEDPDRFAERLTANIVTGFVPNIIRQPVREMSPVIRDSRPAADDGFFTALAKSVGYSVAPQNAPAKIDVWGNPVPTNRGELVGGTRATDMAFRIFDPTNAQVAPKVDPLDRWIFKWNLQTADSKERVAIEPIGNSMTVKIPGENKARKLTLTPQEQAEVNRAAGQAARAALGDGWEKRPLTLETAEMITKTVQDAQRNERARLKSIKLAAGLPPEK